VTFLGLSLSLAMLIWPLASVGAQAGASIAIQPSPLTLSDAPQPITIQLFDAAPFQRFELELRYDAEHLRATALSAGEMLNLAGGAGLEILEVSPGLIRFGASFGENGQDGEADPGAASEGRQEAGPSSAGLPQGSGQLAVLTLAPIAASEAALQIEIDGFQLVGADGSESALSAIRGQVIVAAEPSEENRAAYIAQSDAMAVSAGGSAGPTLGDTIRRAFEDLGGRGGGLPKLGPYGAWIGVLLLALATVGIGWQIGRNAPSPRPESQEASRQDL
jgi:hypothetical protein